MPLTPMNRALLLVTKRAEKQDDTELHETFVDSGIVDVLSGVDHQVLFGRRGTGKTHAFSFLASEVSSHGDVALSLDLRTIGSADGIFGTDDASLAERASRLLVDLLGAFHDSLLNAVLEDSVLVEDEAFVQKADQLLASITSVRVRGDVEATESQQASEQSQSGAKVAATAGPVLRVGKLWRRLNRHGQPHYELGSPWSRDRHFELQRRCPSASRTR